MDKRYKFISKSFENFSPDKMKMKSLISKHSKNISIEFFLNSGNEIKFSLMSMMGKVELLVKNNFSEGLNSFVFCVKELKKGVYFLEMTYGNDKVVEKIVLE